MSDSAQIGVTGLAVMGSNLARNFARHGHAVAVHNRTDAKTRALVEEFGHEGTFLPSYSAEDFVAVAGAAAPDGDHGQGGRPAPTR